MAENIHLYEKAMRAACSEARNYLGATSPNPAVGAAALDADGAILGVAGHHRAGEMHAEALLIKQLREQHMLPKVKTLCVTLEPCNHYGRTPPCTEAIISSGIKRIVIGTRDPNPDVTSGGLERMKQTGIEIITDILPDECKQLIHPFAYYARTGKPWITIKRAINAEGTMFPQKGKNTFTGQSSLTLVHRLRKKSDAIMTGSGTILADNPAFSVRHVPDHPNKRRFLAIMDRRGRVSADYIADARKRGLEPLIYQDIESVLKDLTAKGVQDILVEAGPSLSKALLDSQLWNMSVTMSVDPKGGKDKIHVEFNGQNYMPFHPDSFQWDMILPTETDYVC